MLPHNSSLKILVQQLPADDIGDDTKLIDSSRDDVSISVTDVFLEDKRTSKDSFSNTQETMMTSGTNSICDIIEVRDVVQQRCCDDHIIRSKQEHTFPLKEAKFEEVNDVPKETEGYIPTTLDEIDNYWSYSIEDDEKAKKVKEEELYWNWSAEEESSVNVLSLDNIVKNLLKASSTDKKDQAEDTIVKEDAKSAAGYWDEAIHESDEENEDSLKVGNDFDERARRVLSSEHIIANILRASDYYGTDADSDY